MKDYSELVALTDKASTRRLWLLDNALQCAPLDRAIELARTAEEFLTNGLLPVATSTSGVVSDSASNVTEPLDKSGEVNGHTGKESLVSARTANRRSGLELTAERRERLIGRLSMGARNAELATEFGLSPKQVQGVRIGCAREIAKRREQTDEAPRPADSASTTSVEEVVRYLRQQDDVVVPEEGGAYLVNGRFHMGVSDLVARANRMRSRQLKPAFALPRVAPAGKMSQINGHPLFWGERTDGARSST